MTPASHIVDAGRGVSRASAEHRAGPDRPHGRDQRRRVFRRVVAGDRTIVLARPDTAVVHDPIAEPLVFHDGAYHQEGPHRTFSESSRVTVVPQRSVKRTTKVPDAAGVPESRPLVDSDMPPGSAPTADQVPPRVPVTEIRVL